MKGQLSPSLMCADMLNLQSAVEALDSLGVEFVHLDFMDGKFVPNVAFDTNTIKAVKSVVKNIRRDIHIMAYEPEQYFDRLDIGSNDVVAVHYEACKNLHEVLAEIKSRGASAFVAISPDTGVEVLADYAAELDGVLVMTVYPGFAGQPIAEGSFEKIEATRRFIDSNCKGAILEVDGHVSWDMCQKMRSCGADLFVAGSSSVYAKGIELSDAVVKMRALID